MTWNMSVAKGVAAKILAPVPSGKAFFFYTGIGKPTDVSATSLKDFGVKLKTVDVKSLEFHLDRGDFEKWVYMLGDGELTKGLIRVRERNIGGEKLRADLVRAVQTRVRQLERAATAK